MRKHVATKLKASKCLGWFESSCALGFPFKNSKAKSHLFSNSWGSRYLHFKILWIKTKRFHNWSVCTQTEGEIVLCPCRRPLVLNGCGERVPSHMILRSWVHFSFFKKWLRHCWRYLNIYFCSSIWYYNSWND